MEFSITKKSLLDCLSHFQSVVERRNTIPILSNLKISALEGGLSLTATDLALELSESLTANVKTTGGITIPSQLFFEIIRKAPESSQISLKQDDKSGCSLTFFVLAILGNTFGKLNAMHSKLSLTPSLVYQQVVRW